MELPRWTIVSNRTDIHDDGNGERAFVSFKNAGYVVPFNQSKGYFLDKAIKFLSYLFSLEGFGERLHVERVGVRSKFIREYQGSFDQLREQYITRFVALPAEAKTKLNAKLIDVGWNLNFSDKVGNFNTVSGPMADRQMRQFFSREEGFPAAGIFLDVDYWIAPKKEMSEGALLERIRQFSTATWERYGHVCELILEV